MGTILIFLGLVLVFLPLLYKTYLTISYKSPKPINNNSEVSFDAEPIKADEELLSGDFNEELFPNRIIIPTLSLDIPIAPAKVVNGRWEVFEDSAGYGTGSGLPGKVGNIVIFAHARKDYFLPLEKINLSDRVYLLVNDKVYIYEVNNISEVLPNDISVIKNSDVELLTLYTCSGFADSKRLIVNAKRI